MTASEAIRMVMKDKRIKQLEIAEAIGVNQSNIAMHMKSDMKMKTENLLNLVNACGCNLMIVDRDDPSKVYVIGEGEAPLPLMGMPAVPATPVQPMAEKTETQEELIRRIVQDELRKAGVVG